MRRVMALGGRGPREHGTDKEKNRRRHGGMAFIIFNRYLCMKWKTITNSKFFIKCDVLGGGG